MMYGQLCTEFYDIDKKFASDDEVNFYKQYLNKKDLILEPMCGSGRLLIPLLQEDFIVHGVDSSHFMLNNCRERAFKLGFNPELFEAPIEKMSLPHSYNAILIPFGSFQLLHPRSLAFQALQNFSKHLLPGGKLILDLFVPWDALYENNEEENGEREVVNENREIIKIKSHNKINKHEQFIFGKNVYQKILNGKVIAEEDEQMYVAWYYRYEAELILEKYGFKNIQYQEIYLKNENHMIFIAER